MGQPNEPVVVTGYRGEAMPVEADAFAELRKRLARKGYKPGTGFRTLMPSLRVL